MPGAAPASHRAGLKQNSTSVTGLSIIDANNGNRSNAEAE